MPNPAFERTRRLAASSSEQRWRRAAQRVVCRCVAKAVGEFADKMNAMPKHVVSRTLQNPEWNNSKVIRGDVAGEVTRLKDREGGPMLVAGSRTLVHTLMKHDLVDEYRIMIFPVVLGSGRRLFPETQDKVVLRLANTRTFSSGVVVHSYHRPHDHRCRR